MWGVGPSSEPLVFHQVLRPPARFRIADHRTAGSLLPDTMRELFDFATSLIRRLTANVSSLVLTCSNDVDSRSTSIVTFVYRPANRAPRYWAAAFV